MDYREHLNQVLEEAKKGGQRGRAIFLRLVFIDPPIDLPDILFHMPEDDQEIIDLVLRELNRANDVTFFAERR
jgi:hypothetical protein